MSSRPTEPSAQACAAASLTFVIKLGGAGDPPDVGTGAVTVGEGETPVVEVTEAVSQDATNSAMATVGTIHLADICPIPWRKTLRTTMTQVPDGCNAPP